MYEIIANGFKNFLYMLKTQTLCVFLLLFIVFCNFIFLFPDLELLKVQVSLPQFFKLLFFLVNSIFIYIYLIILTAYSLMRTGQVSFFSYLKVKFLPVLSNTFRAYNHILFFTFLLILPGLYKYIRLIFVPYLTLEPSYDIKNKKNDVIKASSSHTSELKVMFIVLCFWVLSLPVDLAGIVFTDQSYQTYLIMTLMTLLTLLYQVFIFTLYSKVKLS